MGAVFAVLGGSGGVGASTFAAVLARVAGAVLIDVDPIGGGLDVLLGIESVAGARWRSVHVDGGRLDPRVLRSGLPRWADVPVLAVDRAPPERPIERSLPEVVCAASASGPVVLDLPRAPGPDRDCGLAVCDLAVVVAEAQVRPLAAARAVVSGLAGIAVGLLMRRGEVPLAEAVALVGAPLLGVLPRFGGPLASGRVPRAMTRLAAGLLDGLAAGGAARLRSVSTAPTHGAAA